jgi:molybdate transport system substrate-binding protein
VRDEVLVRRSLAVVVLACATACGGTSSVLAQQPVAVVVASDAVEAALQALQPALEREAGGPISFRFGTSPILSRGILSGDAFDVAVLPPAAIADLRAGKKISEESPVNVGRVGIGIGIRAGARRQDIDTADGLKEALLSAKAITYVKDGASRANTEQMVASLGLAEQLAGKTILLAGYEEMGRSVVAGQATLVIAPLSEIPLMPGVAVLGPLPLELQSYVAFQAVTSATSKNANGAAAIVRALGSSTAAAVYRAKGMDVP